MKPLACLACVGTLFLSGCVDQYGRIRPPDPIGRTLFNVFDPEPRYYGSDQYVVTRPMPSAPPVGYYERRTVAPVNYANPYWRQGYWGWGGNDWAWTPSQWVERPRANAVWYNGRYYTANNRQYYRSGYWR